MSVHIGDAVRVPFGTRERVGVVVGAGEHDKATKQLITVCGRRSDAETVRLAKSVAHTQHVPFSSVAKRLAPRGIRDNPPLDLGSAELIHADSAVEIPDAGDLIRRYYTVAPGLDMARIAALEAQRLAQDGQVLVLCPTKMTVRRVVAQFQSGAAGLDTTPKRNEPSSWQGFIDGTLQIGVGSRAAALWSAQHLAGIIVVDEGHPGHIEAAQPYTNARDIASARTADLGIPMVLIGSDPSPVSLATGIRMLPVGKPGDWPHISVVERTDRQSVPGDLIPIARKAHAANRPVLVCAVSDTKHYWCTHCNHETGDGERCERCGSTDVRATRGAGWLFGRLFPDATVLSPASTLKHKMDPKALVLVDLDTFERLPNLYPGLSAARTMSAAARIAGPGGEMVVVTSTPDGALPQAFQTHDLRHWAVHLWDTSRVLGLPPFRRMVTIRSHRRGRPSVPVIDHVRWYGPTRRAENEWETVAITNRIGPELDSFIEQTKRRGKSRVSIV